MSDDAPAVRIIDFDNAGNHLTVEAAAIVRGTGEPLQQIDVAWPPLVESSVKVFELVSGTWRQWSARPDFVASGRADADFVADPTNGTITLGDGEHGRTATSGSALIVLADLTNAGAANLAIGAIDRLGSSVRNHAIAPDLPAMTSALSSIANVVPGDGGAGAETTDAAIVRVRQAHLHTTRAVTADDYVTLSWETPGTSVARVEVRPNLHPGFPCIEAPGIVTVLVLPTLPRGRPLPSTGLRNAISRHLNGRRVIGTRVEVVGPTYVTVVVRATVSACVGADLAAVQQSISERLEAFFDPLDGGPWGTGWPFGCDVFRAEILAVIDGTDGVSHVVELELVDEQGRSSCGDLCVAPLGLVDSGPHEITAR